MRSICRITVLGAACCLVTLGVAVWTGSDEFTTLSAAGCLAMAGVTAWVRSDQVNIGTYSIRRSGPGLFVRAGLLELKVIYRAGQFVMEIKWS